MPNRIKLNAPNDTFAKQTPNLDIKHRYLNSHGKKAQNSEQFQKRIVCPKVVVSTDVPVAEEAGLDLQCGTAEAWARAKARAKTSSVIGHLFDHIGDFKDTFPGKSILPAAPEQGHPSSAADAGSLFTVRRHRQRRPSAAAHSETTSDQRQRHPSSATDAGSLRQPQHGHGQFIEFATRIQILRTEKKNHDSHRRDRSLRFFLRPESGQFSPHIGRFPY